MPAPKPSAESRATLAADMARVGGRRHPRVDEYVTTRAYALSPADYSEQPFPQDPKGLAHRSLRLKRPPNISGSCLSVRFQGRPSTGGRCRVGRKDH